MISRAALTLAGIVACSRVGAEIRLDPVLAEVDRQLSARIVYDARYVKGGVAPSNIGTCIDVVIRAFAKAGIDLKREVNADIRARRKQYRFAVPDSNIDHRRCRNTIVFMNRYWENVRAGQERPGDVVYWSTKGNGIADHVGIVINRKAASGRWLVAHHWPGQFVEAEDILGAWQRLGTYRMPSASRSRRQ